MFDMICGTSSGGLIALMLGTLKMTIVEAIHAFFTLCKRVFRMNSTRKILRLVLNRSKLNSYILEEAMKKIVQWETGSAEKILANNAADGCKT